MLRKHSLCSVSIFHSTCLHPVYPMNKSIEKKDEDGEGGKNILNTGYFKE